MELPEKEGFAHLVAGKKSKLEELAVQFKETQELDKNVYKDIGVAYLKELEGYLAFADYYNVKLYLSYKKLVLEAEAIDLSLREEYLVVSGKINNAEHADPDDLKRLFVL